MLLTLVDVSVKVVCQSTIVTACRHRATSMLPPCYLIWWKYLKVACWSMIVTACSHSATYMLLILVEVSVKVAYWSMTATDCSLRDISMLLILRELSVKVACRSMTARLQAQSYHHATYSGGSICESGLLIHYINRLQLQS